MKKLIFFLVFVLMLLVLTACYSTTGNEQDLTPTSEIEQSEADPATEIVPVTEAHVHSYGNWSVVRNATCKQAGEQERVCACGAKETKVIAALEHTPVTDKAVAATCTKSGKTGGSHCSVCGAVITAQELVPATGHTPVTDKAVSATCTEAGKTEGSHCAVCNSVIKAQEIVPPSHNAPHGICLDCNYVADSDAAVNYYVSISTNAFSGYFYCYYNGSMFAKYAFADAYPNISFMKTYDGKLALDISVGFISQLYDYGSYFNGTGFLNSMITNNGKTIRNASETIKGYGGTEVIVRGTVYMDHIQSCNIVIYFDDYDL